MAAPVPRRSPHPASRGALDSPDVPRLDGRLRPGHRADRLRRLAGNPSTQSPLAIGTGLGVGLLQGRLLAPLLGGGRSWVAATTLGLSLPFALLDVLRFLGIPVPHSLAAYIALGGVLAGALQWRILRRLAAGGTAWWPVITPIGWLLAGSTVWINELLPRTPGLVGAGRYIARGAVWRPGPGRRFRCGVAPAADVRRGGGVTIGRGSADSRWCTSAPCS